MELRDYQSDLIRRTYESMRNGNKRVLVCSPCGSGKSYMFAKMIEDSSSEVLILTHRRELKAQHENLMDSLGINNFRVAMIQTEANRLGYYKRPHLIVADEAHLSRSDSWQKVIEYYDCYTAGFTASPVRLDGKPLGDIFSDMVVGVTVKELIRQKRLAPYIYYAPFTVDAEGVKKSNGDYQISELEQLMNDRAIYSNAINSWAKFAYGQKTICYCVSVKHAEMAESFNKTGIPAAAISGQTPEKQRGKIMQDFRDGKILVMCNCNIVSEGVSIDDVMCCLMLRPTDSLALNIQQSQRCMRYLPDKTAIILDCVGNYTRHGLPDDEHEWSLTQSVKRKPPMDSSGNLYVRTCPNCFQIFKTADVCPYCGEPYPLSAREIKAHEEIELKKIEAEEMERLAEVKKRQRMEVGRARTFPELVKIGTERGYKNPAGWAYMVMKGRK